MAVLIGTTVIHKVAVKHRCGIGLTACGQEFQLADRRYDPNGAFEEEYLEWLLENRGLQRTLCMHCPDRQPAWERKKYRK